MKIAIIDNFHWPPVGGGTRAIKEVANGFVERDYETTLITPNYGFRGKILHADDHELKFKIHKLDFNKFNFNGFYLYKKIKSTLMKLAPDAVLIGNANLFKPYMILASRDYPTVVRLYAYELLCPLYYGLLFKNNRICEHNFISSPHKCIPCMFNKKYIAKLNFEALRSFSFLLPLYRSIAKESLKYPEKFIITSTYMKKRFSEVIPTKKLKIIPHGVATDKFKPYDSEKSNREFKLIFAPGRADDPIKGLDTLLEAANILWKHRRDFRILITSYANTSIIKYPFLIQEGWKSGNEIYSTYATSDLVVVPSIWAEPFGLAALEAMSSGVAVIASRTGGLTDFIEDGKTGILVPPGDHEALASKINELLDNDECRLKLGTEARKHALQYSWSKVINEYIYVIEKVLNTR